MSLVSKRRKNLWNKDPHCYWCGIETVNEGRNTLHNRATLDHLYSRYHKYRKTNKAGQVYRTVLACSECNNLRQSYETLLLDRMNMWKNQTKNAKVYHKYKINEIKIFKENMEKKDSNKSPLISRFMSNVYIYSIHCKYMYRNIYMRIVKTFRHFKRFSEIKNRIFEKNGSLMKIWKYILFTDFVDIKMLDQMKT